MNNTAMRKKATRAKELQAFGRTIKDIASTMKVSERTVSRYISYRYEDEDEPEGIVDPGKRAEFVEQGWPVLLKSLAQLEAAVDSGEMKPKDLANIVGVLSDRLRQLSPPPARVTETSEEKISFVFFDGVAHPQGLTPGEWETGNEADMVIDTDDVGADTEVPVVTDVGVDVETEIEVGDWRLATGDER